MSESESGPEPGPLGEEAAKLFEAAQEWWVRGPGSALRMDRAELRGHLSELQGTAALLLRGLADIIEPRGPEESPAAEPEAVPPASPAPSHVQPIKLDRPAGED
jgi:hypothetical protein